MDTYEEELFRALQYLPEEDLEKALQVFDLLSMLEKEKPSKALAREGFERLDLDEEELTERIEMEGVGRSPFEEIRREFNSFTW